MAQRVWDVENVRHRFRRGNRAGLVLWSRRTGTKLRDRFHPAACLAPTNAVVYFGVDLGAMSVTLGEGARAGGLLCPVREEKA
jgi:hypothetical protein